MRPSRAPPSSPLQVITWSDVFVLVERGTARPIDYVELGDRVVFEAATHPGGIGGLTIVTREAAPPSGPARTAIRDVLERLGPALRCHCWLVEGAGFQGAMVRGVLTSVRMLARLPFESHVSSELEEALGWILRRLDGGDARLGQVEEAIRWVEAKRRELDEVAAR